MQHTENKYKFIRLTEIKNVESELLYDIVTDDIKSFFRDKKMTYHVDIFGNKVYSSHVRYYQAYDTDYYNKKIKNIYLIIPFLFVDRKYLYINYEIYNKIFKNHFSFRTIKNTHIVDNVNKKNIVRHSPYLSLAFYIYFI